MTNPPTPADTPAKPCIGNTMESCLEMPKPDRIERMRTAWPDCVLKRYACWELPEQDQLHVRGQTSIERYATEQHARAEKAEAENERLREALERIRDCNFVIKLPDRMDAVRDIAREAIHPTTKGDEDE